MFPTSLSMNSWTSLALAYNITISPFLTIKQSPKRSARGKMLETKTKKKFPTINLYHFMSQSIGSKMDQMMSPTGTCVAYSLVQ